MSDAMLNRTQSYFDERGAGNTAREIARQPDVWRKLAVLLDKRRDEISAFMEKILAVPNLRIVFTGAGSSAFIGESMQMLVANELGIFGEAVHTTDIVSAPAATLADVPTLLVSYSRSGESPESLGAVRYASKKISQLYNLVLVCKEDSSVANDAAGISNTLVLCLPPESCDLGFAMTCSVSCMALATWCAFGWRDMEKRIGQIYALADTAKKEIDGLDNLALKIAAWDFDRIVYLGSGALRGLAREAAIKMLELTAGEINAGWDTPAGFRHGPKSVICDTAVSVHLLSPVALTRRYDDDLLREMLSQRKNNKVVAAAPLFDCVAGSDLEAGYSLPQGTGEMGAYLMGLIFVQLVALEKSLAMGNITDNPCAGGEVNRVVKGIIIYPLED